MPRQHYSVLIVGAGTGGIMTAAQLRRARPNLDVAIIDPAEWHAYQAAWTLVGAGTYDFDKTRRRTSALIPKGVDWIQDRVVSVDPEAHRVETHSAGGYSYDYLVLSPGIQMDIDGLPGLREALATDRVCSNYTDPKKTWEVIQRFSGGQAVFTQAPTPIKCGGGPQKIAYLAEEAFERRGIRQQSAVVLALPGSVIFGVPDFAKTLSEVVERKHIHFAPHFSLSRIDSDQRLLHFRWTGAPGTVPDPPTQGARFEVSASGEEVFMPYDMVHLAPPQRAPDFIRTGTLAAQSGPFAGWLEVDTGTLKHTRWPRIFGLGDAAGLPTAKTGAAIRKQVPVLVENLLSELDGKGPGKAIYEGYSSCPFVTGYGKMVLAEFKYANERDSDPLLSRIFDTTQELWPMWLLKKYGLPYLYWNRMLKGKM